MSKEQTVYFNDVKEGDKVFGLVFGKGIVSSVWDNSFYTFEVEYDNGSVVPYTDEGIPGWNNGLNGRQTVFYKQDVDLMEYDFTPAVDETLSIKKIIKLRTKNKLDIKCPSGIWKPINSCPSYVSERYLEDGKLHLFRKEK